MQQLTYRLVIRTFRLLFVLLGLRIEIRGEEHLPASGPAVIACNHTGFLDFSFVGLAASRRGRFVRFMAKQSTFDNRISGPWMRAMRHIPVDRACGATAARQASDDLRRGELVGIFPEATISRAWTLKPFKRGAATLAVREAVPIIPVAVWGAHRVLTVDGRWSLRRGKAITVHFGPPIRLPESAVDAISTQRAANARRSSPEAVAAQLSSHSTHSSHSSHSNPSSHSIESPHSRLADFAATDAELRRRMQGLLDQAQASYPDQPRDDADRWWMPHHLGGSAPTPLVAAELDAAAILP